MLAENNNRNNRKIIQVMQMIKETELPTNNYGFTPEIEADMHAKKIDLQLTRKLLNRYNEGKFDNIKPVQVTDIPSIDGETVIDLTNEFEFTIDRHTAQQNIDQLGLAIDLTTIGTVSGTKLHFSKNDLKDLGIKLYPTLSYGILNGGSASSYFDTKKNQSLNETLFNICRTEFNTLANIARDLPKGLAPAFINKDGSPGPSFIELKMRSLLIETLRYQKTVDSNSDVLAPLFQMTSVYNNEQIEAAYQEYSSSKYLADLINETKVNITDALTGIQPMLAAFSHSKYGRPKTIFTNAYGKENNVLPMPGGHGQNFEILRNVYQQLLNCGKRFAYLGNVDNLGYTVDPVSLALLALQNKAAGFEFSFRTAVDIKGGILIKDQQHRLNCADIGPAISAAEVLKAEATGKKILFNCATGLFNLKFLVEKIDYIIDNLPVRFSDQDKDAGLYSQAEQVTWEIIGMLDNLLIFGVDKYDRFLAAKLVLENLMASGVNLQHPDYPSATDPDKDLKSIAHKLHHGLQQKLKTVYGLKEVNQQWVPKTVPELIAGFQQE